MRLGPAIATGMSRCIELRAVIRELNSQVSSHIIDIDTGIDEHSCQVASAPCYLGNQRNGHLNAKGFFKITCSSSPESFAREKINIMWV